jgi:hypothetical protein
MCTHTCVEMQNCKLFLNQVCRTFLLALSWQLSNIYSKQHCRVISGNVTGLFLLHARVLTLGTADITTCAYCADITTRPFYLDMHTLPSNHHSVLWSSTSSSSSWSSSCAHTRHAYPMHVNHHPHHHASGPHSICRCIGYACGSWDTCIGYTCRHGTCRHAQLVSNVCPFFLSPAPWAGPMGCLGLSMVVVIIIIIIVLLLFFWPPTEDIRPPPEDTRIIIIITR